jgi:photosystem II stability/assembly factor-like uncharacterized protein
LLSSDGCDTISVDFSDPNRRTLLHGGHEQINYLYVSFTSGKTWRRIEDGIPPGVSLLGNPLIVGDNTFVVPGGGKASGMYRTTDAGRSWRRVSTVGAMAVHPFDVPLVVDESNIYWLGAGGLVRSADAGLTWEAVSIGLQCAPIQAQKGELACVIASQIAISRNKGSTWTQVGPPLPFTPHGIAYLAPRRTFYAWRFDNKGPLHLVRWKMA